jgi:hypothetical protein
LIIQYIYINMLKKKFIFEDEEEQELTDYQQISRMIKRKISANAVEFYNSEGEDFSDHIEIKDDGIMFTFNGLQDFLTFFFPDDYSKEDNSEGYYDASYYELMYEKRWDWYDDFSNRNSDDWSEGYIVQSFRPVHLELLISLAKYSSPDMYSKLSKITTNDLNDNMSKIISSFLETIGLESDIVELYTDSNVDAVRDSVPKGIEDKLCNCLKPVGIDRYSDRYCFWKYHMGWGDALLLFANYGTDDDSFLDLLFSTIKKTVRAYLPEYYEMESNYWDSEKFEESWLPGLTKILEKKLEDIEENPDNYDKNYFNVVDKVMEIGGVDVWIKTKDGKYEIRINGIEPDTSLIYYTMKRKNGWDAKGGKTDIDSFLNLIYNEKMFDLLEQAKKFSILRNKTFL